MNLSEKAAALLQQSVNAVVATIKQDGSPQLTPVWFHWDGEVIRFSITKDRVKYPNLCRDPRLAICIDSGQGRDVGYVTIYGEAELNDRPEEILEPIRRIRRRYQGEERAAQTTVDELSAAQRVLVSVRPHRMVGAALSETVPFLA